MPADTSMTVEVVAAVKVRQRVNIVALFQTLTERDKLRYRNLAVTDLGFEHEWERPVAFLLPEERDLVPTDMLRGSTFPLEGDIEDVYAALVKRGETITTGKERDWTEGDFETLTAQVPWLRHFHEKLNTPLTQHELDRIPGPDDVPMF